MAGFGFGLADLAPLSAPAGARRPAFAPKLADKSLVAEEVAREWQSVRLRERMDWLYNYDATAIAV